MNNANNYAQQQADIFKQSLQYLIDQENTRKQSTMELLNRNYENAINKLNQSKLNIEEQYLGDTRQAYVNKLMTGQSIRDDMNRLGLNTTGFAATQNVLNENQYSANLNNLALDRNASLRALQTDLADLEIQHGNDLLELDIDYNDRLASLNQYINEQVENKYQTEYAKFYDDMKYQNELREKAAANNPVFGGGGVVTDDKKPVTGPSGAGVTETRVMGTMSAFKDLGFDVTGLPMNQSIREYKDAKGNLYYLVYSPDDGGYIDVTEELEKFREKLKKQEQNKNVSKPTGTPNYSKPTLVNKPTTSNTKTGTKVNDYVNASLTGTTSSFLKNNSNKMYTGR